MLEYVFILGNALAINLLIAGVILLNGKRNGGLLFFRIGRFGGSFYIARR